MFSLYETCLNFLTLNLDLLDSLSGLPDIIGKEIFDHAKSKGCFSDAGKKGPILEVFSDAFGHCGFLDSFSLKSCHLFLNDTLDEPGTQWLYQSLRQLDLTSCSLGDDHEILTQLTSLQRLDTLILAKNVLSDQGVRKLTTRTRMYGKCGTALKYFDLSGNPGVSVRSLEFLKSFPSLRVLRVSNTRITQKSLPKSCDAVSARWAVSQCSCFNAYLTVITCGWAGQVVENWMAEYVRHMEEKASGRGQISSGNQTQVNDVKRFYGKRKRLKYTSVFPSSPEPNELTLTTTLFQCQHTRLNPYFQMQVSSDEKSSSVYKNNVKSVHTSRDNTILLSSNHSSGRTPNDLQKATSPVKKIKLNKQPEGTEFSKQSQTSLFSSQSSQKCSDASTQSIDLKYPSNRNIGFKLESVKNKCKAVNDDLSSSDWLLTQYMVGDMTRRVRKKNLSVFEQLAHEPL